jgi:hypothetical protein
VGGRETGVGGRGRAWEGGEGEGGGGGGVLLGEEVGGEVDAADDDVEEGHRDLEGQQVRNMLYMVRGEVQGRLPDQGTPWSGDVCSRSYRQIRVVPSLCCSREAQEKHKRRVSHATLRCAKAGRTGTLMYLGSSPKRSKRILDCCTRAPREVRHLDRHTHMTHRYIEPATRTHQRPLHKRPLHARMDADPPPGAPARRHTRAPECRRGPARDPRACHSVGYM